MSSLIEIENVVAKLSPSDFSQFREWFFEYENQKWDKQIEADINSDKLLSLSEQATEDFNAGKFTTL